MLLLFFIPLKTRTNRVWFFQDSHDSVNDLRKEVLLRVVSLLHFTLLYTKNSDALVATIRINPPKGGWVGSRSFVAPEFLAPRPPYKVQENALFYSTWRKLLLTPISVFGESSFHSDF